MEALNNINFLIKDKHGLHFESGDWYCNVGKCALNVKL